MKHPALTPFHRIVIPAKAGYHFDSGFTPACNGNGKIKMDPGFRWDDVTEGILGPLSP